MFDFERFFVNLTARFDTRKYILDIGARVQLLVYTKECNMVEFCDRK